MIELDALRGAESDAHVWLAHGLPGIDLCALEDPWAYHTALDTPARLQPGLLQALGDDTLATVRALAAQPRPATAAQPPVFYDLLGTVMVVYSARTARVLGLMALLVAAAALMIVWRRRGVGGRALAVAVAVQFGATLVGLLAAEALALLLIALGRAHAWYAQPALGFGAFAAGAVTGTLAVHAAWARRSRLDDQTRGLAAWAAALVGWSVLNVVLPVGVGYLALWWLVPGALGLVWAAARPRAFVPALLLAVMPGLLVTVEPLRLLLPLFAGYAGTGYLGVSGFDPGLAFMMSVVVALLAPMVAPLQHARAAATGCALALTGLVGAVALLAVVPRYTPERPQRISMTALAETTALGSMDLIDPTPALRLIPNVVRKPVEIPDLGDNAELQSPAIPLTLANPSLEVVSSTPAPDGKRAVVIRIRGAGEVRLRIPRARLAGWSLERPLPELDPETKNYLISFVGLPPEGREVTLTITGDEPVEAKLSLLRFGLALPVKLPAWAIPWTAAIRTAASTL
jgi:hypothetical protein